MKPIVTQAFLCLLFAGTQFSFSAEPLSPLPIEGALTNSLSTNDPGPRIQFAAPVHDFGKVVAGEVVKHDFVFTNVGDAELVLSGVYASCGCTALGNWTRQVEPGNTGIIPLQFNSSHFNGPVAKSATVACNDKKRPTTMLQIKGTVWKPIDVSPQTVILTVVPDSPSNTPAVVRIVSSLDEPIILSNLQYNTNAFAVEMKTNQPGKEFLLSIQAVPPFGRGTVQGVISVNTSSTNVPVINVTAVANVQPALVVMPSQIMLPPIVASNTIPCAVSIRNNSAGPLTLSEPSINAPGIDVQIREVIPGRQFTVTATFPAGFEMADGRDLELTVKTSNPQHPNVVVPVRQAATRSFQRARPGGPPRPSAGLPAIPAIPAPPPPPVAGR
jgi:hypothetical protein